MTNVNVFIKDNASDISSKIFVSPDIPEKKLNNAVKAMNLADSINTIIAIFDNTLFGSAKEGIAFTGEKVVYRGNSSDPIEFHYEDIKSSEYIENVTVNSKGKEKKEEFVKITLKSGESKNLTSLLDCNYSKLSEVIHRAATEFDSFEEEDQLVTLAEMPEELKVAYVKVIINMAFSDDGLVDEKEFAQILLLMTRLELSAESRFNLREYITSSDDIESLNKLIECIDDTCTPSHNKSVKISLVKDLFSTFMSVNDGNYEDFKFFEENKKIFNVNEKEVELIIDALKLDFQMLDKNFTDDALTQGMKELSAKAGAVGVPMAAIYLTGTMGMSAAGLTSGLATLGLGGALGFSSMATGIGVAVLLGVGAYKGIKHITGANELDKTKRRELMLKEVIKQTQSTISLLMKDVNFITEKLRDAITAHGMQDEKVKLLMQKVKLLTSAGQVLTTKSDAAQNSCFKLRCPLELDHEKLKSLTREATKQQVYSLVMSFYEEKAVEKHKDGETVVEDALILKETIPTSDMEKLGQVFDAIGYFKASEVIKGKLSGMFS